MKYLISFNESKVNKNLSESDVRNLLVELLDFGFDIKITSTNGFCRTRGFLNKEIDMAEFLDNLLSFITKMEYSGYQRVRNEVSVKEERSENYNTFEIDFKLKDFTPKTSDVNNFTSFEGYINNIGFKYMDNYSEIDVYEFNNIDVVCYEKGFFISIKNFYNTGRNLLTIKDYDLKRFLNSYEGDELNTLSKNITYEVDGSQGKEHPYNKESTEILLKIIKIIK
jgi:hypothetical protein